MGDGFATAEVRPGDQAALADFMTLVVLDCLRPLDVLCINCPAASRDEEAMLAVLSALQAHRPNLAFFSRRTCMIPAAARLAVPQVGRYVSALNEAGLGMKVHRSAGRAELLSAAVHYGRTPPLVMTLALILTPQ